MGCFFFHSWGEWRYVSSASCTQQKTCSDCGDIKTRIQHDWGNWEPASHPKMDAIIELRKTLYYLSSVLKEDVFDALKTQLKMNYLDIEGRNLKAKYIFLFTHLKEKNKINELFDFLQSRKNWGIDFLDEKILSDMQERLASVDLEALSFSIPEDSSCYQKRNCRRDQELDTREEHTFDEIKRGCNVYKVCPVCGTSEHIRTEHDWGEWIYCNEDQCDMKKTCLQCGISEDKYAQHVWLKEKNSKGNDYTQCKRCEKEEFDITGEWKGKLQWRNGQTDLWKVSIQKKTGFLGFEKLAATFTCYLNYKEDSNQATHEIRQKATITVSDRSVSFKTKDIQIVKGENLKYYKDEFYGYIKAKGERMEGSINGGEGLLTLE